MPSSTTSRRVSVILTLLASTLLGSGCLDPVKLGTDATDGGTSGSTDGAFAPPTGAAALSGESFPPELLQPYTGPASDVYDDTFLRYPQLKNRIQLIFNDAWMRGGTDQFAAHIALFGGVDFVQHTNEARSATPDYFIALNDMSKDVCAQASTMKTGPFAKFDPTTLGDATTAKANVDSLYQSMLFRHASATEQTDASTLLTDLVTSGSTAADAWSGLCEALIHHQDFLFTLAPSFETSTGADHDLLLLVRVAQDLVARPPTATERDALTNGTKTFEALVDDYLASNEFRDWFFYRMRIKTQSAGTDSSDEPARLWTWLAMNDAPFQDLFAADYAVDPTWNKVSRGAEHGKTGILTMPGFIAGKPGLPHYTYSARVLGDYLGATFEVTPQILALRITESASSTVDPNSICFSCHQMLTPLAYQRQRWTDDGVYQSTDANNASIDDSDRGVVPSYPFKGQGLEGFAAQAIKKEAFIRRMFNALSLVSLGRELRAYADERVMYKKLWDLSISSGGNLRQLLKAIILSPTYRGN